MELAHPQLPTVLVLLPAVVLTGLSGLPGRVRLLPGLEGNSSDLVKSLDLEILWDIDASALIRNKGF